MIERLRCKTAYRIVLLARWIWPPLLSDMVGMTIDHIARDAALAQGGERS